MKKIKVFFAILFCKCVRFAGIGIKTFNHPLVAGIFNIAAKKDISHPYEGIEPMHRKNNESQRLYNVIAARKMRSFVCDNAFLGSLA